MQKTTNSQSNLEREKGSWRNQVPDIRLYSKATVIKTYTQKQKYAGIHTKSEIQINGVIESPELNPHTYGHLTYDKAKIHNGEKTVSSTSGAGKTWQLHAKE